MDLKFVRKAISCNLGIKVINPMFNSAHNSPWANTSFVNANM